MACVALHNVGMPSLSYVYPYPAQGRADSPTDEDKVADVPVRRQPEALAFCTSPGFRRASLARTIAEEAVAVVGRRTGLGPHPAFTPAG